MDKEKQKESPKKETREETLKRIQFLEKYFQGLTQEHFKNKYQEIVEEQEKPLDEQELFIWEFLFKNKDKLQKMEKEEQELFIWEFLFKKKKKK